MHLRYFGKIIYKHTLYVYMYILIHTHIYVYEAYKIGFHVEF